MSSEDASASSSSSSSDDGDEDDDDDLVPKGRGARSMRGGRGGRGRMGGRGRGGRGRGGRGRGGNQHLSLLDMDSELSRPPGPRRRFKPGPFADGVAKQEEWVDPMTASFPTEVTLSRVEGLPAVIAPTLVLGMLFAAKVSTWKFWTTLGLLVLLVACEFLFV